jgi:tetratricopeptide (TPR) repeat protein
LIQPSLIACAGFAPRRLLPLLMLVAAAIAPARAEPMVPGDASMVLERLPDAQDPARQALHALHAQLMADPANLTLALRVARGEMAQCRKLFDPRACGRAEAALGPWIAASAPPPDVLLLRGLLLQTNHLFDAALADLGGVLAVQPDNAQALLTRAVVHEVRAEYALAQQDCGLAWFHVGNAAAVACLAGASSLTGHATVTLAALKLHDSDPASPAAERLWALTVEGEIAARLGRDGEAESAFTRARAITPDDSYLLGAYADLLLDLDRPREVVAMLADRTRIDPLLLRLAEAEERLGTPDPAHVAWLAQSFETSRRRGDIVHEREHARFLLHVLHRPQEALTIAESNWRVQREPADARILMEAALAAKHPEAAAPALSWYRGNGVEDLPLADLARQLAALPAAATQ